MQFYWEPSDKLSFLLAGDLLTEQGTGYTGTNFANPLGNGVRASDIDDPRDVYARGITPIQDTRHWGAKFEVNYEFDNSTLQFLYGHRDLFYDYQASTPLSPDYPGVVESLGGLNIEEALDDFSRFQDVTDSVSDVFELRYFTSPDNTVFYTAGLFYFLEDQATFLGSTADGQNFFQGNEFNQPDTDTESIAAYLDGTWNFSEQTKFTAGIRFTDESKSRRGVNAQYRVGAFGLLGPDPDPDAGEPILGFRFGTEGFEFAIDERTIFNADQDGSGLISDEEYFLFILDGIKTDGERDNFADLLRAQLAGEPLPCIDTRIEDDFICPLDGNLGALFAFSPLLSVVPQTNDADFSFFDWRVRAEHNFTDENLLYFTVATGHKSGSFNDTFAVPYFVIRDDEGNITFEERTSLSEFDEFNIENIEIRFENAVGADGEDADPSPERVINYELGSKNEFDVGNVGVRLNASLFYQDYTDQIFCNVTDIDGASGGGVPGQTASLGVSFCFNTDRNEIFGSQLDGALFLPREFTFKWSFLWLEAFFRDGPVLVGDSRFQRDIDFDNTMDVDISGNRLPRTPQYAVNLSLGQSIEFPAGKFDYIVSASWRDEQHLTVFNGIQFRELPENDNALRLDDLVNAYWTVDVGAGFDLANSNFRFEAFANNITNEVRPTALLLTQMDNTRFFTRPRTWGGRIKWNLN